MYYREDNAIGLTSREYLILSIIPASSLVILYLISDLSPLLRLISCISLILINLSYLIIYDKFLKENYERQRFLEIEKQNHYYHQQIINQDEIRKLKHDLKNILITIDSSIQNNDVIQAQKQIDTLLYTKVLQYDKYTGCIVIDSILTSKLLEMKKHNITYTTNLKIPNNLEINHNLLIDISAIWGNLLDNAIEGVLRLNKDKQKIINITVNYDRGKLIFNIQNTANLIKTDFSNKLIKSEKGKRYGIGISSIKERVDRLKGYYDFNYHNEKYAALIIIPINKEISL
ncbi:GHKL domain-containing protein [Kandleria vitulina]|uniref:GHKL domain-containing protein n=1 Tax=Kandleria vitulina TaxID=1630 RepID=UPI0018AF597F|nr:GHKL domain-containing protein [Kandleria vitulina]